MKKIQVLVFTVITALMLSLSFGLFADDLGDLQSSKDELEQKKDETQDKLDDVKEDKSATKEDLTQLQSEIGVLQEDIAKLQTDLSTAEGNLATQQEEYDTIIAKLETSQDQMRKRVRSIYVNGDVSYWDVLFSADSISDFLSNFTFFEKITEQDKATVNGIQENKALAEEKLAELEETKNQIASIKSSKENQESQLSTESDAKDQVLASLEEDEAYYEESLAEFEKESANVESQIQAYYAEQQAAVAQASAAAQANVAAQASAAAEGSSTGDSSTGDSSAGDSGEEGMSNDDSDSGDTSQDYSGTGSMRWPVNASGRISSNYGARSRGFHTGIDIAISKGTPVLAADSGKVILVKRLTYSYGQYVVIDHGNSTSTLYAHQSAIYVSQGQTVEKGQQIGAVGSTGNSTGPHLHFEVRINGKHVNPWGYVSQP